MTRPVLRVIRSPWPARLRSSQKLAVRRSCQTMALWMGSPAPAIPDDRRFALVGDADGRDVCGSQPSAGQRGPGDLELAGPDLQRVVLDPAGLRKDLRKLLLGAGADRAGMIKQIARELVVP